MQSNQPSSPWRTLGAVLSSVTAVAVAVTAIYFLGPWSGEPLPESSNPRPVGAPVKVPEPSISVLAAGDILVHPELTHQARRDGGGALDFNPMFAAAAPTIAQADLALCHLEAPLAPPGGPYSGFPKFSVPQEIVPAIKNAGFDGCSTASDHIIDQGYDGVKRTLDALDRAQLGHTGSYRDEQAAKQPRIYEVKGVRVAHLSYTRNFNDLKPAAGQEWMANVIDPERIDADADAARIAGAEIVVVSLHWGTEYEHEPDVGQQTVARAVAEMSSVNIVFGHHAHVVQPIERLESVEGEGEKWVVYGMGNQLARHAESVNQNREGAMIRVTFGPADRERRWKVAAIEAIPIFVDLNPNVRLVDLELALADPTISPARRRIYEAAVDRVQGHLLTRGADEAGLVVRGMLPPSASPVAPPGASPAVSGSG